MENTFSVDQRHNTKKISQGLSVLTSLTLLGSMLEFVGYLIQYFRSAASLERIKQIAENGGPGSASFLKNIITPEMYALAKIQYENKIPLLVIGVTSVTLCVYGALQMRSLKSEGYYIYLVGEVFPVVGKVIFIGLAYFSGLNLLSLLIPLLFIILYTYYTKSLRR